MTWQKDSKNPSEKTSRKFVTVGRWQPSSNNAH